MAWLDGLARWFYIADAFRRLLLDNAQSVMRSQYVTAAFISYRPRRTLVPKRCLCGSAARFSLPVTENLDDKASAPLS